MCISVNNNFEAARRLESAVGPDPSAQSDSSPRWFPWIAARWLLTGTLACVFLQLGCAVGPKYTRPSVQAPSTYKELPPDGSQAQKEWKVAQPNDASIRGKWWELFNDPQLNDLEQKAIGSNQNIAAAAANFLTARALVREARSQYFPTVIGNLSIVNSRPSSGQFGGIQSSSGSGVAVRQFTDYSLPFDACWEPDFWGASEIL